MTAVEALGLAWASFQAGRYGDAERACRAALDLDPSNADGWCLHGLACRNQGKPREAADSYRQAVRLRPNFLEALNNLGNVLLALGQLAEACACYEKVLALRPDYAQAHNNLGAALRAQDQVERAIVCYEKALQLAPSYADAHNNLGDARAALGQWERAESCYRQALALQPGYPEALNNLGVALVRLDRIDEAIRCHEQALGQRPHFYEAHNNLGNALIAQRKLAEAERCYRETVRLRPDYAQGHYNLGIALAEQGRLDEALASYQEALRLKPDHTEARGNLGNALRALGRMDEALACYRQVLELKPDDPDAHMSRALAWLLLGDYERGWPEYEWRWRTRAFTKPRYVQPRWDGSPLAGRTLLLHPEQGLGDTIQFVRYAPLARARGGKVVLACPKALRLLLSGCAGVDQLVVQGEDLPPFDTYAPLLSLPGLLGTTLATVPAEVPYLHADPELVQRWRRELEQLPGFKVGIVWQGNPDNRGDRYRSVPLRHFAALAAVPGVRLISLQKGPGTEQLAAVDFPVTDLGPRLDESSGPFRDSAAVLQCLDLVVVIDTALAHLAGALAVPAWVALSASADWRWLLDREDSPWYPTVRLFRQRRFGEWEEVFARMAEALKRRLAEGPVGPLLVEVSAGELLDKITILQIKKDRLKKPEQLRSVQAELAVLTAAWERAVRRTAELEQLTAELRAVNEALWEVEDALRDCERAQDFGEHFVELARRVYRTNDRRSALKRQVNDLLGSRLREEKSYGQQTDS
jgi:tetratricopeptide (TPR) repeat protein